MLSLVTFSVAYRFYFVLHHGKTEEVLRQPCFPKQLTVPRKQKPANISLVFPVIGCSLSSGDCSICSFSDFHVPEVRNKDIAFSFFNFLEKWLALEYTHCLCLPLT